MPLLTELDSFALSFLQICQSCGLHRAASPSQSAKGLAHSKTLRAIRLPPANAPAFWTAVDIRRLTTPLSSPLVNPVLIRKLFTGVFGIICSLSFNIVVSKEASGGDHTVSRKFRFKRNKALAMPARFSANSYDYLVFLLDFCPIFGNAVLNQDTELAGKASGQVGVALSLT